jgi:hypothetical protein
VIKIFKGKASEVEKKAIERALLLMKQENESEVNAQYGKPILRSPFEINQKS